MPAIFAKPQQIAAATKIETIFSEGCIHYCFLNADVQSGKTGCFQHLIRRMLQTEMVDRVYILCGSNDTELYDQAKVDTALYNSDLLNKITVIFRQDFPKHTLNVNRALIVVDESHMDQNVRNKLAEYLGKFGLGMDGTRDEMLESKTYILSVDATGYAEISAIQNGMSRPKQIVNLEPGTGYWGPSQYYEETFYVAGGQKLLQPTFSLASDPARFKELFAPNTWNMMRVPGGKKETKQRYEVLIRQLCAEAGVDVYRFTSTHEEVEISCEKCENGNEPHIHRKPCLSMASPRPALVLLDGRLRAGKVVPKRHIGFVWEGAKLSNTDAVIQGLLGRVCGYKFGDRKPTIFLPGSLLKKHVSKELTWCELERHIFTHCAKPIAIPTKATNVVAGHNPKRLLDKHHCPPIRFHLGEDAEWADERRDVVLKAICFAKLRDPVILQQIIEHPNMSEDQKSEILGGVEMILDAASQTTIRNISASSAPSQQQYLTAIVEAANSKKIATCQDISDPKLVNFVVVHPSLRKPGIRAGDVVVVFYTKAVGPLLMDKPTETMFGDVKKSCAFVKRVIRVREDVVASVPVGMTKDHFVSPDAFKAALETFIRRRLEDETAGFSVTPCLHFHPDHRTFSKSIFAYTSSKQNTILTLLRQIEQILNISCSIRFVRGGVSARNFQMESISWKRRA